MQLEHESIAEGARPVVLLVEDDAAFRELLAVALAAPDLVVRAFDRAEAAEPFVATAALLVTDVQLPGLSGIDLGERARRAHPQLSLVVVSADASMASSAERLGAAFLAKPFDGEALAALIRARLGLTT